jgi:hypothetical protein
MAVDLSVFERQKTVLDQQQLQEAFNFKKAAAIAQLQNDKLANQIAVQKLQTGAELPSNVREYQFYNSLPQPEQEKYLSVKRATQTLDLGGGFGRVNPTTNQVTPFGGGAKVLTPQQEEEQAAKKREATDMFNRGLEIKTKALESVNRLLANPSGVRANRGGLSTMFPNISDSAVDAEADLTNVSNLLTTENLGLLKGVLSDTDMKVLASIGSGELQGSDKKVMGALRRMQTALSGKVQAGKRVQSQGFDGMPPLMSDPSMTSAPVDIIPEGAVYLGTQGGKAVYKLPDGRGWTP